MNFYATRERAVLGHVVSRTKRSKLGLPFFLVFAAISFNFFLCFIHTNIMNVSTGHVIAAEILIIGLTLVASYRAIGQEQLLLVCALLFYLMVLAAIRTFASPDGHFDVKIMRDFLIPIAFYLLGTRMNNLTDVDSIVRTCAIIVVAVAIYEYFFLESFLRYFNVLSYYISRGTIESEQKDWISTTLFVSGIRPEGRSLLPFLGDRRVSSLFLEPVSPGNFAVTLFFWALVRSYFERKLYFGIFLMAIFLTIMADNRFGTYLCAVALIVSMLPSRYMSGVMTVAPFVIMPALLGFALWSPDTPIDNSLFGRLLSSGRALLNFDIWNWLGVGRTNDDVDSGYAYTISRIGIFGSVALWILFTTLRAQSRQFQMFRAFTALYFSAILCVSYSPYTIKTAGLLWFLLGALSVTDPANPLQSRREDPRVTG